MDNGSYTVTLTVTDEDGSTDSTSHGITVIDLGPAAELTGDSSLAEDEAGSYDASGSLSFPDSLVSWEWDWDYDGNSFNPSGDTGDAQTHAWANAGNYTVAVRVTDDDGSLDMATLDVVVSESSINNAPVVGPITAPLDPVKVDNIVPVYADFTDANIEDTHTAKWNWGDGKTSIGSITESNGNGSVTGNHEYLESGVYIVTLTVTDDELASGQSEYQYVVIYDPDGASLLLVVGFDSPNGAYTPDSSLTGKATFGFVSKYKKGASILKATPSSSSMEKN
jgi:PKD repeat protein